MAHELKKRKKIRAEVVNLHPAMRAFTDSFIVSNPGQNYTVSDLYVFCEKHISLREKWLSQPQKGILVSWCNNLMGEFADFCGETSTHIEKTESASTSKQTIFRGKKIRMLQNALLRITRSSHSLSTNFAFFILGFMDELFKPRERLKLPAVNRNTATDRNRPIVYIWWSWKLIYTCLC